MSKPLGRTLPVRVSLIVIAIVLFLFVGYLHAAYQVDMSELYKWLVGTIIVGIAGDTWRPSGILPGQKDPPPSP